MTSDKGIYVYLENHLLITYLKKKERYTLFGSQHFWVQKKPESVTYRLKAV